MQNLTGKSGSAVRVINRRTAERTVLKGFDGRVIEIAFANTESEVVLGAVDEKGNLHVYRLLANGDAKMVHLFLCYCYFIIFIALLAIMETCFNINAADQVKHCKIPWYKCSVYYCMVKL